MKKQPWMVFKTSNNVYYLWNGTFAILISVPVQTNPASYYWMGNPTSPVPLSEKVALDSIAGGEYKELNEFELEIRKGQKFEVVSRGEFITE